MATSTLIQFLDAGALAATGNRSQTETFLASAAIAAGDWVSLDVSKTGADKALNVVKTTAVAGQGNVVGVALDAAAAAGDQVRVCVAGYCASANVVTGTAAGASLTTSGATAGRTLTYASGTHTGTGPCGVALTTAGSNTAEVWVFKRF